MASSQKLANTLRARFGRYAGPVNGDVKGGGVAPNLGIDFAAGQCRRRHGPRAKRRQRLNKLRRQAGRVARLRAIAGKRTPSIFVAGPLSAAVYGAAVNGLSDQEVLRIRRAAAHAYTPRARGRSLRRLLLIVGVPTWKAEVEVLLQYSREIWSASLLGHRQPRNGQFTLTRVAKLWRAVPTDKVIVDNGKRRTWSESRGPITALHLTLHRIGWKMDTPFTMTNDMGDEIVLTKVSPQLLAQVLQAAVLRTLQREVGGAISETDSAFAGRRAAAEHITSQLKSDKRLSARDKAAYMSVACCAVMTFDKERIYC